MPVLALPFPDIDPVAISIGPVSIKWYGLAYVAGLLLGWWYVKRLLSDRALWRSGEPPMRPADVDDLFLWVALGVIAGGRLGQVLLYEPRYYFSNPLEIFKIWKGGMAFHGGMIGTIVAMWFFARSRRVEALSVMDLVAAAVPIGLFFGRIANFINGEVVGRPSSVPWAMPIPGYGPEPRHPSQLYEAFLEGFVLFLLLLWLIRKRQALATPGLIGASFLAGYGALRMFCELFKHEEYSTVFSSLPVTTGFVYSALMAIAGLIGLAWVRGRRPT